MTNNEKVFSGTLEPFIERKIPELGIAMIRLEGTREEIDREVSKLASRYPDQLSTFDDAQLLARVKKPWGDDTIKWGDEESIFEEIYYLWVVRKL